MEALLLTVRWQYFTYNRIRCLLEISTVYFVANIERYPCASKKWGKFPFSLKITFTHYCMRHQQVYKLYHAVKVTFLWVCIVHKDCRLRPTKPLFLGHSHGRTILSFSLSRSVIVIWSPSFLSFSELSPKKSRVHWARFFIPDVQMVTYAGGLTVLLPTW